MKVRSVMHQFSNCDWGERGRRKVDINSIISVNERGGGKDIASVRFWGSDPGKVQGSQW